MGKSNELKVAVLILGHNHKDTLKDTFCSALNQTFKNYKVIYIDNASRDGSVDYTKEYFPTIAVVANDQNLGYAGGYDVTIRDVFLQGYDAAVLLNPDTVVDRDWLTELVESAYTAPDIALVQSKVLLWDEAPTDIINTFGNNVHFLGFGFCGHYKAIDTFSDDIEVPYASGSSLLIKKEYYPSVISFDTDFFAYLEDQDLGWQARLLGLRVLTSARSKVWHKYEFRKKSDYKFYLLERNRLYFLMKYWSFRMHCLILPAFIIMELGVIFHSIAQGYFIRKLKATMDFFCAVPNLHKKRLKIQKNRTVSDRELLKFLSPTIVFEEVDTPLLRIANFSMKRYFQIIRKLL